VAPLAPSRTLGATMSGGEMKRPDEPAPVPAPRDHALEAAAALAHWLDHRFVDPLLGLLLPGVGDLLGSALGLYPVLLAWQRGAPKSLLARMILNLAADAAGGAIPVLGDVWDFFFRAHARNLDLLRARAHAGEVRGRWTDVLMVACALLVLVAALALPVVAAVWLWRSAWRGHF
jgi:hypothetical protein